MKRAEQMDEFGSRGVAMLEFSLIVILFFGVVLIFIDLAHYFVVRMMLVRAAQQALTVASTDPRLQHDFLARTSLPLASSSSTGIPSDPDGDYSQYLGARHDAVSAASGFSMAGLISPPGSGGFVELSTFRANDEYTGGVKTIDGFRAAVIRPGEGWYSELQGKLIDHPAVCSTLVDPDCESPRTSEATMRNMLQLYPIVVVLEAKKRSILAWGKTIPVTVSAVGWAQIFPKSPYDIKDYIPGGAIVTPTPTPCPVDPPGCVKWYQSQCACGDEQVCPPGQHWDENPDVHDCSSCPLAESYLPGQAPSGAPTCPAGFQYIAWQCYCECPQGYYCDTGHDYSGPGGSCGLCLDDGGTPLTGD